jgi:hypothetical protein
MRPPDHIINEFSDIFFLSQTVSVPRHGRKERSDVWWKFGGYQHLGGTMSYDKRAFAALMRDEVDRVPKTLDHAAGQQGLRTSALEFEWKFAARTGLCLSFQRIVEIPDKGRRLAPKFGA